jgi:membrane protein DedA with SNARE-associated domain
VKPDLKQTISRGKNTFGSIGQKLRRAERRTLVAWIRYAQKNRQSLWLPFVLFAILFLDGFLMFIPSMLLLVAATTISPQRWVLFAVIFAVSVAGNNAVTYFVGRHLPMGTIMDVIAFFNLEYLWASAQSALQRHGSMATFVGALMGLPTQMITALIGLADAGAIRADAHANSTFLSSLSLSFCGHFIKAFALAGLTRFGWVKLEKKFQKTAPEFNS